jgi:hypothetical protein
VIIPIKLLVSDWSRTQDQSPDIWWIPYENIFKVYDGAGHFDNKEAHSRIFFLHGHDQYVMPSELSAKQLVQYINDCLKIGSADELFRFCKHAHGDPV